MAKSDCDIQFKAKRTGITVEQLRAIMPRLTLAKAEEYLPYLNEAAEEFEINTPKRWAAFLAQIAHESGELRYWTELASGDAYEGRVSLGNLQKGDGRKFKGRSPIQLTGRANYRLASKALDLDLLENPERAADPDVGFRIAAWFWKIHGLNELADKGLFDTITKIINGGYNGKPQRDAYWATAKKVLEVA